MGKSCKLSLLAFCGMHAKVGERGEEREVMEENERARTRKDEREREREWNMEKVTLCLFWILTSRRKTPRVCVSFF